MLKSKLVMSVIAMVLLSACGRSSAASSPSDVVIGTWQGTDSPSSCPLTQLVIASDSFTMVQDGVASKSRVLGIGPAGTEPNVVEVMTTHGNDFHVIDANHIQLDTPLALCSYSRKG